MGGGISLGASAPAPEDSDLPPSLNLAIVSHCYSPLWQYSQVFPHFVCSYGLAHRELRRKYSASPLSEVRGWMRMSSYDNYPA